MLFAFKFDVLPVSFWHSLIFQGEQGFGAFSRLARSPVHLRTLHTGCVDAESCLLSALSDVTFPVAAMLKVLICCSFSKKSRLVHLCSTAAKSLYRFKGWNWEPWEHGPTRCTTRGAMVCPLTVKRLWVWVQLSVLVEFACSLQVPWFPLTVQRLWLVRYIGDAKLPAGWRLNPY